jgi:hypothetical protein
MYIGDKEICKAVARGKEGVREKESRERFAFTLLQRVLPIILFIFVSAKLLNVPSQ